MAISNYERVGKALNTLRDGLKPVLEEGWAAKYGKGWLKDVASFDKNQEFTPSTDDLAFLLKGFVNTWQDIWREQLGRAERNYVSELWDARNRWAHNESFSGGDAHRVLDTAERLLTAFYDSERAQEIQASKHELLREQFRQESRTEERRRTRATVEGAPTEGLPAWRDLVTPHADVAAGSFEQAEFAADLHQVVEGTAEEEYANPVEFFRRTYITDGLRRLLANCARRVSGNGGDPVVELQTNFGGGKTHSLIAIYHLGGSVAANELPGLDQVLADEGLTFPDRVNRAAFVGQMARPASPETKPDGTLVHTIWGELAWQLGGAEAYAVVADADKAAKNPGSDLKVLFRQFGPAVVMIDEWVAYARQLQTDDSAGSPAGDFDTQFTFAQALTEAAAAVPNVVVLISIPASDIEVGGEKGRQALDRLKNVVSRTALQWQPATSDESFEIVRRRLFEDITPDAARRRDDVVNAYMTLYRQNETQFPSEVNSADYRRRLETAYPIHPELFDRLYNDWSTLERFQRTRGVLRLMAMVISDLWNRGDRSTLILPGTLPLDSEPVVSELIKYLEEGWEPVIRGDVDGPNSLPLKIDQADAGRLGRVSATRRVARAVYLGSAPREEGKRGVDVTRVLLGVVQPGESPPVFGDALRRLSGEATYLYVSGSQYWYSLQANVNRLAQDRATSNVTDDEVKMEIQGRVRGQAAHPVLETTVFPDGPGDVPDEDDRVRLAILPPSHPHIAGETSPAKELALRILDQRSGGRRINRNLLVFLAADAQRLEELRSATRLFKAWQSIVAEQKSLNLNEHQREQAASKATELSETVDQRIAETYQHVIEPHREPRADALELRVVRATHQLDLPERVIRKLESEEWLVRNYAGIRVRHDLDKIDWDDRESIDLATLWSFYAQHPYMTRLASFEVLADAVGNGVAATTWDSETFAYAGKHDSETGRYEALVTGQQVQASRSGLIVRPDVAIKQMDEDAGKLRDADTEDNSGVEGDTEPTERSVTRWKGEAHLDPDKAGRQVADILEHVVQHLRRADLTSLYLTIDVEATSSDFPDEIRRTVSENASQVGVEGQFDEPEGKI